MNPRPGHAPRPLLLLGALVVLLHWWALKGAPVTIAWPAGNRAQAFSVRAVDTVAVALPVAIDSPQTPMRATTSAPKRSPPRDQASLKVGAASTSSEAASLAPATEIPAPTSVFSAVGLPGPARWHYSVTAVHRGAEVRGSAELAWWHDGDRYEASLRIDAPPIPPRVQRSEGQVRPQGLAPRRFSERWRTEEAAHFDRAAGRIVFSGRSLAAPLRPGAQDRLSVLLQLAAMLSADPQRWSQGDSVVMQTATTREAHDWRFTVEGGETVALPAPATAALKLTRAPQREYEPQLELWFVPGRDYGPVRLRLTAPNGDWLDLQWSGTDKG